MEGTVKVFGTEPEHLWHLFTTRGEPNDEGSEANLPVSGLPNPANPRQCSTLEVMMSGLPVETMKPFYKSDTMRTSTDVIAVSTSDLRQGSNISSGNWLGQAHARRDS